MVGRDSIRPEKIKFVEDLAIMITKNPVVGLYDAHKMPSSALQKIKYELYGKAIIRSVKKSLLLRALEKSNKKELIDKIPEQPGIMITEMNPFKLYKIIDRSKSNMNAKPGDIAPEDIEIKSGPTDLMPGPAITTLSKAGLQPKVEGGKIAILRDKVVCKAGSVITLDLASVLGMLKISPIPVGLNVTSVYEDGIIYGKDVLSIDDVKLTADLINAYWNSINLAVEIGFVTKETVEIMIGRAVRGAMSLESLTNKGGN
ncbi:MAG: 50S ribosomal protein L10 [Nanoarchaeota archaeon]|nr:50S ribosomal protein L10 [Nanoarchaeota archaeon]MBU4123972.1 50S ribosomal protein L10 [Nanoarchaeota archaeon]